MIGFAALAVASLLICGFLGFLDPFIERAAEHPFEESFWQVGSLRERGRMARDLQSSGRLVGLNRKEVLSLLGPPDRDDIPGCIAYTVDIGHKFGSQPWTYSLTVHFDEANERVGQVVLHD